MQNGDSKSNLNKTRSRTFNNKRLRSRSLQDNTSLTSAAQNSIGFAVLPTELLSEVLSYIPRPMDPLSTDTWQRLFRASDAKEHLVWRQSLMSLSRTCRRLRQFLWPQLWRRIEICEGMYSDERELLSRQNAAKERLLNVELIRQLEVVTVRDPHLAEYVNVINIEVVEFSVQPVLVELARCLTQFPNLRAIKLRLLRTNKTRNNLTGLVQHVFRKYRYPQIRSVGICELSYPFLTSCPEAISVKLRNASDYYDDHLSSQGALPERPFVKSLELALMYPTTVKDYALAFPNISQLTLKWNETGWPGLPSLDFILSLSQLCKIEIYIFHYVEDGARMVFLSMVVKRLLELQGRDGEEKEAIIHYPVDDLGATPTLTEKRILPAPRRS